MRARILTGFILCAVLVTTCSNSSEITGSSTTASDACERAMESGARERFSFEQITPCLDTPENIIAFLQTNMQWQPDYDEVNYGGNVYLPAGEVYQNGTDDCDGLAELIACALSRNGYEAYNVGISVNRPWGFNVAGYVGEDGKIFAITNNPQPEGPFESWAELAQVFIDAGLAEPDGVVWLFAPCIASRVEGDAVLALEHQVIR